MDPTTTDVAPTSINQDVGAWALSRLGIAIDAGIDRELRKVYAPPDNAVYGIGPTGQVYRAGTPVQAAVAGQAAPAGSPLVWVIGAGVVLFLLLGRK